MPHGRFAKRLSRRSLIITNSFIIAAVFAAVFVVPQINGQSNKSAASAAQAAAVTDQDSQTANPLDQLSSADIAVNIARMEQLPEATAVANQADSVNAELTMSPATTNVVAKPQVVTTTLNSRQDIKSYTTQAGDTVPTIAAKFGVTSDSIRWSNNLNTDQVAANQKLVIPPVNGIVYTVQAGDTADSLAQKFNANKEKLVAFNDAEINGLKSGEQILIPDGTKAAPIAAAVVTTTSKSSSSANFAWGGSAPVYGYNGYDSGYCTWYVASRIAVPSNWGNANTWDNLAPQSGWTVSTVPTVGSIAQTDRGSEGHVAIVEAVSADGTQIKYSDMNGLAGFGRVGYSDWTPISHFMHYISH